MKYYSVLYFLLLLNLVLWSATIIAQEQVTHVENFEPTHNTQWDNKVGFTNVDGDQYLIVERDSVIIYRVSSEGKELHKVVPNTECKYRQHGPTNPNRSGFDITPDGKYYRYISEGLQIIDIPMGTVEQEYTFKDQRWSGGLNYIRTSDFITINDQYTLDCEIRVLSMIREVWRDRTLSASCDFKPILLDERLFYVNQRGEIEVFDYATNRTSVLYEPSADIIDFVKDITADKIWFVDSLGMIQAVDALGNLVAFECLNDIDKEGLVRLVPNGAKLALIYVNDDFSDLSDSIKVWDVNSCSLDMSFDSDLGELRRLQVLYPEKRDTSYTFFGFEGFPGAADSYNPGKYFYIDHQSNRLLSINNLMSGVRDFSIVEHNDDLYFVGDVQLFSGWRAAIYRIDREALEIVQVATYNPEAVFSLDLFDHTVLGYEENGELVFYYTDAAERHLLSHFDSDSTWQDIGALSLDRNLGFDQVYDVILHEESLYLSTSKGLYYVPYDDDESLLISVPEDNLQFNGFRFPAKLMLWGGYLLYRYPNTFSGQKCFVIDIKSNEVINEFELVGHYALAEPYLLSISDEGRLIARDLVNMNTFMVKPYVKRSDLQAISGSEGVWIILPAENRVIYIVKASREIKEISFDAKTMTDMYVGVDEALYIFTKENIPGREFLYSIAPDGTVKDLAIGSCKSFNKANSKGSDIDYLVMVNNQFLDQEQVVQTFTITKDEVIKQDILLEYSRDRFEIREVGRKDGIAVFEIEGKWPVLYMLLQPDQAPKLWDFDLKKVVSMYIDKGVISFVLSALHSDIRSLLTYSIGTDSFEVYCPLVGTEIGDRSELQLPGYNHNEAIIHYSEDDYDKLVRIDVDTKNVANAWVSDVRYTQNKPQFATIIDDWMYFVALAKGGSRQLFRVPLLKELEARPQWIDEDEMLMIQPVPASNYISLPSDYNTISLFDTRGSLVLSMEAYQKYQDIDVSNLPSGLYYVLSYDDINGWRSGQFVKM